MSDDGGTIRRLPTSGSMKCLPIQTSTSTFMLTVHFPPCALPHLVLFSGMFTGLKKVRFLFLDFNRINTVPAFAFCDADKQSTLVGLDHLGLSFNLPGHTSVDKDAFRCIGTVTAIILTQSSILKLPMGTFLNGLFMGVHECSRVFMS